MIISRTNNQDLPDSLELTHILDVEADRPLPAGKFDVHYPEFYTIIDFLEAIEVEPELFTSQRDIHSVVELGKVLLDEVSLKVFKESASLDPTLLNNMWDYLSEEDELSECDTVFVFGSKTPLRAVKAAEVFVKSGARRIVVSGGGPIYSQDKSVSEAENYKKILLVNNVPEDMIILETQAITVPDNVRRSLNLLDELGIEPKGIALVNSPYSQRRGWAIYKKYLPDDVSLARINCESAITRDNWFKSEDTFRIVLNEFVKMRASVVHNTA
jgi:DUF218 domain